MSKSRKPVSGVFRLPKSELGKYTCQNKERIDFCEAGTIRRVCSDPATHIHRNWRFGDTSRGESPIQRTESRLCAYCADCVLDRIAEMDAEAAAS